MNPKRNLINCFDASAAAVPVRASARWVPAAAAAGGWGGMSLARKRRMS